jgi:hypothetical protein
VKSQPLHKVFLFIHSVANIKYYHFFYRFSCILQVLKENHSKSIKFQAQNKVCKNIELDKLTFGKIQFQINFEFDCYRISKSANLFSLERSKSNSILNLIAAEKRSRKNLLFLERFQNEHVFVF